MKAHIPAEYLLTVASARDAAVGITRSRGLKAVHGHATPAGSSRSGSPSALPRGEPDRHSHVRPAR